MNTQVLAKQNEIASKETDSDCSDVINTPSTSIEVQEEEIDVDLINANSFVMNYEGELFSGMVLKKEDTYRYYGESNGYGRCRWLEVAREG